MTEAEPSPSASAIRQVLIDLSIMAVIGLVLALIGPFGSFAAPFPVRLVYWLSLAIAGYAFYRPISGLVAGLAPRLDLPEAPLWVAGCLIATIPMTAVVWIVSRFPGALRPPTLPDAIATYGSVLVIGAAVTTLFYFLNRNGAAPQSPPSISKPAVAPPAEPTRPRFLDRLPPRLGAELLALEMEDHYVRAHTRAGSDLILLRMRDAVAELDGMDGAQVHRSWWVARSAVESVTRDGRNIRLRLAGGLEAPVSRNNAAALEAAGWW